MADKRQVGEYRQGRKRITEPVLRVDTSKVKQLEPDVLQEVKDYLGIPKGSKPPLFVSKTQGWLVAVLLAVLATAVVFVSYTVLKREYEFEHQHRDLQEIKQRLDKLHKHDQELERKLVEQDTKIENMRD